MKRWTGPELILAALKAAGITIKKKPVPVTPEMISKSSLLQKRKRK